MYTVIGKSLKETHKACFVFSCFVFRLFCIQLFCIQEVLYSGSLVFSCIQLSSLRIWNILFMAPRYGYEIVKLQVNLCCVHVFIYGVTAQL